MKLQILVVVALMALSGCSCFREVYHFKATEGDTVNYFRTTVSGWTLFSASQYAAGNYDADAVDALFGELKGAKVNVDSVRLAGHPQRPASLGSPAGAAPPPSSGATSSPVDPGKNSAKVETLAGDNVTQKKFVFFLSSNSDFFINQINTYVTTRDMQQSIVTLILKDDMGKLYEARSKRDSENASSEALAAQLRTIAAQLRTPSGGILTNTDANDRLVEALKALAFKSNVSDGVTSMKKVEDASRWLKSHPGAFTGGN